VPGDLRREFSDAGGSVSGISWPSVQSGPRGFYLPDDQAEYTGDAPEDD